MYKPRRCATESVNPNVSRSMAAEWETPEELFRELDNEFHFTLDAAAQPYNAKCARFFTPKEDGLKQSWRGERVFCFPPSGTAAFRNWVKKASDEAHHRGTTAVMLLPVSTDSQWFKKYIYLHKGVTIRFLKERVSYTNRTLPSWAEYGLPTKKASQGTRASMVVIFHGNKKFNVE